MGDQHRRPLATARSAAAAVVALLRDGCTRIEIAGSIRRERDTVKDIEIVCKPLLSGDLFGGPGDDLLNATIRKLVGAGRLMWRNPRTGLRGTPEPNDLRDRRHYALSLNLSGHDPWPIDLFCVRAPAQWGAIFAIRTGPADYSQHVVTAAHQRMLKCDGGHLVSIALETNGEIVDTPEERDFFQACGVEYVEPHRRAVGGR